MKNLPSHQSAAISTADPQFLRSDDPGLSERARALIRVGETAIAKENDAALDAFFGRDFIFHGPGAQVGLDQLKSVFAAFRTAFTDFQVRRLVVAESGDLVAARTLMSGIFTGALDTQVGTVAPTGQFVQWELSNLFRYDASGQLAEEWTQYDTLGFLQQLGVDLVTRAEG